MTERVQLTLLMKLGSIAVHAEELFSPDGRQADKSALLGLLADAEVQEFLQAEEMRVLLPVKRARG
jgi:hypothetical protein